MAGTSNAFERLIGIVPAILLACATGVWAQAYPTRPITLIWGFPAGGTGTELAARTIASEASKTLGQPVVFENRPGAGGLIGARAALSAAPDGYTLGYVGTANLISTGLFDPANKFDMDKDYAPVFSLLESDLVLLASPSVPFRDAKGLVDYAKANPGKLDLGIAGDKGSVTHLALELLKHMAQIDILQVPYKGSSLAVNDVVAGSLKLTITDTISAQPHVASGRVVLIGSTGSRRSPMFPDARTLGEQGLPGYAVAGFWGIVAPAGTPAGIVDRLNSAFNAALKTDAMRAVANKAKVGFLGGSAADMRTTIKTEIERWTPIARLINKGT